MALEKLIDIRFDDQLGKCVEVEIDSEALDRYAVSAKVPEAIDRRAQAAETEPKPVTANIHLGIGEDLKPHGYRQRFLGKYNLVTNTYGEMPAADIDILLGTMISDSRDFQTSEGRESYVSSRLDQTLKHELHHFADPDLPATRLGPFAKFTYPGSEIVKDDPRFFVKRLDLRRESKELRAHKAKLLLGDLAISFAVLVAEREY